MWIFFGTAALGILAMLILHGSNSFEKLQLHWNEYRCNPMYMPFAGIVRPDIGTSENFYHCIDLMGTDIFRPILDVLNGLFGDIHSTLAEITGPLGLFRELFARIRKFMLSFMATTFGKIANSTSTFTTYVVKIRDVLKRFAAEGYIASFLVNVMMDFVISFVFFCMTVIKIFVYSLLAASIILALFQPELLILATTLAALIGAAGF